MGETPNQSFQLSFNAALKVEFQGSRVTSDGGLILVREELLTQDENLTGLAAINRELVARADAMASSRRVVLDIDSTEVPVYGQQEQSAYNGHFESTCYHPLLLFNRGRLSGGEAAPRERPQCRALGRRALCAGAH